MKHAGKTIFVSLVLCILSMYGYSQISTSNKKNEVFMRVEQMPMYEKGKEQLNKDIADCVVYPQKAIELGVSGTVVVKVIINTNGEACNPVIVKHVHELLDKATLDIIPCLGCFTPGMQGGNPVSVYYYIPIQFQLPK